MTGRFRLLAGMIVLAAAVPASAAKVVSTSAPVVRIPSDMGARARWGTTGWESILVNEGGALLTQTAIDRPGTPVWQLGQPYNFSLQWQSKTGTLGWSIDFNRNGVFETVEQSSFTKAGRANFGYQFIRLTGASRVQGANSNTIDIANLAVNGTNLTSLSAANGGAFDQWYMPQKGLFRDIGVTGTMTFRNTGGNGAFAQERPVFNIFLVGQQALPAAVPEPQTWALLVLGFGMVGVGARRRNQNIGRQSA